MFKQRWSIIPTIWGKKTNNRLSSQIHWTVKRSEQLHMTLEILVLAWERHKFIHKYFCSYSIQLKITLLFSKSCYCFSVKLTWPEGSCEILSSLFVSSVNVYILIFFFETTVLISTNLERNVYWRVL